MGITGVPGVIGALGALGVAGLLMLPQQISPPRRAEHELKASSPVNPARQGVPERPRQTVEIAAVPANGRVVHVAAAGNLQDAIDRAQPGDRILLQQGATYRGPFHLPAREGDGWVLIESSAEASLPPAGERVDPSHARLMPKLIASSGSVLTADPGAHHYRLVGLEITPAQGVFLKSLVELGATESDVNKVPHHIVLDRCYLHGDHEKGSRRGVAMNGQEIAVINSYLADFKELGADSQAISGWNGPGPFLIKNNYLEAAGENVMFGGADPPIAGLVPADIEVIGNRLSKPLAWKRGDSHFEGTEWTVKNLFELKNARRVLIEGNVFEYNWPQAQNGFAILFTVRNQDGASPWSTVEDITFTNNVVRHVGAGINILGHDDIHASEPTRRVAIANNLFEDVGGEWGSGRGFQLLDGASDIQIDHNTVIQTGTFLMAGDRAPHARFVLRDNVGMHNEYGIIGSGTGPGRATFDRYFPGAIVKGNVLIGGDAGRYPADNAFPASLDEVGFTSPAQGDYRLMASSPLKRKATDRKDPGADLSLLVLPTNTARP